MRLLLTFGMVMGSLFIAAVVADETGQEIIPKVLKARDGITSYHLVIRSDVKSTHDRKLETTTKRYEIWLEKDRFRTDITILVDENQPKAIGQREVVGRNCERKGYALNFTRGKHVITPVTFEKLDESFTKSDHYGIDWRLIGFLNHGVESYRKFSPIEEISSLMKAKPVSVREVDEGKESKVLFESSPKKNFKRVCEISLHQGYTPSRISYQHIGSDGTVIFDQTTTVEYLKNESTGIWYPKSLRHKRTQGETLIVDQLLTFETVELNQPIPEEVFTIKGMDVMDNTPIALPEIKKEQNQPTAQKGKIDHTRKQGDVVRETRLKMLEKQAPEPVADGSQTWSRSWPFLVATVLGIGGLYLLWKVIPQRKT